MGTGLRGRDRPGGQDGTCSHFQAHPGRGCHWGRLRSGQAGAGFSPRVGDTDPPPGPSSASWLLSHHPHTSGQEQPLSQEKGNLGPTERKVTNQGSHRDFNSKSLWSWFRLRASRPQTPLPPLISSACHTLCFPSPTLLLGLLPQSHPLQAASHVEGSC